MSVKKKKKPFLHILNLKEKFTADTQYSPYRQTVTEEQEEPMIYKGTHQRLLQFIENYGPSAAMETGLVVHLFTEFCG